MAVEDPAVLVITSATVDNPVGLPHIGQAVPMELHRLLGRQDGVISRGRHWRPA